MNTAGPIQERLSGVKQSVDTAVKTLFTIVVAVWAFSTLISFVPQVPITLETIVAIVILRALWEWTADW